MLWKQIGLLQKQISGPSNVGVVLRTNLADRPRILYCNFKDVFSNDNREVRPLAPCRTCICISEGSLLVPSMN
jgi:hypothetical protein